MGSFSVFHFIVLLLVLGVYAIPALLPLWIKPSGSNRFGPPSTPHAFPAAATTGFRKYFDFNGRATRSEYWWFWLAAAILWIFLTSLTYFIGEPTLTSILPLLLMAALLIPLLAAGARRLHDINRSGWWLVLSLIGFGWITLIVLLAWPSQKNEVDAVF